MATAVSGDWKSVSGRNDYACGVKLDNSIHCWGSNNHMKCGDGVEIKKPQEVYSEAGQTWIDIGIDTYHTCAIDNSGDLYCWGNGEGGKTGHSESFTYRKPKKIDDAGKKWSSVSTGKYHTCAVDVNDDLYCFGYNSYGQLGNNQGGNGISSYLPQKVEREGGATWKEVSSGETHTCAINSGDILFCWGRNNNEQLGVGDFVTEVCHDNDPCLKSPMRINVENESSIWSDVSVGGDYTCAVKDDGKLYCWGESANKLGLGSDNPAPTDTPQLVEGEGWKAVSTGKENGSTHTCGTKTDDSLYCWGYNGAGQLGLSGSKNVPTLSENAKSKQWSILSLGKYYTCGITSDDELYCWGWNNDGMLGNGTTNGTSDPTLVSAGKWKKISSSYDHTCAIDENDKLYCWGNNRNGVLGLNRAWHLVPNPVVFP